MNAFLQILAAPVSAVYAAVMHVRNWMYQNSILKSHKVSIPTICVGNLAVGGTGKTPHVEYILRLLTPHYRVAVLSRGYKRKTHGFVLADENANAALIGDEAMQIHAKFPQGTVAVCEDRVTGVHRLMDLYSDLQVVVLDDAYQHRRLQCGFYLLLTAHDRLYVDDHFLPLGRLRDTRDQYARASAVVVTKCPTGMKPIDRRIIGNKLHLPPVKPLYFSHIAYPSIAPQMMNMDANAPVVVLAGIAHPEYLLEHIQSTYPQARLMAFPDHHAFSPSDVTRIEKAAESVQRVFTTEKDYTRLQLLPLSQALCDKLYALPIHVQIADHTALDEQILQYVKNNLPSSKRKK